MKNSRVLSLKPLKIGLYPLVKGCKRRFLLETIIFRGYVSFRECNHVDPLPGYHHISHPTRAMEGRMSFRNPSGIGGMWSFHGQYPMSFIVWYKCIQVSNQFSTARLWSSRSRIGETKQLQQKTPQKIAQVVFKEESLQIYAKLVKFL